MSIGKSGDKNINIETESIFFNKEISFLRELILEKEKRIDSELLNLKELIKNLENTRNKKEETRLKLKIAFMGLFGIVLGYFIPIIYKSILIIIK